MDKASLDKLEELFWRWKRHYQMLEIISQTNLDKTQLKEWKNTIDNYFKIEIKSKL